MRKILINGIKFGKLFIFKRFMKFRVIFAGFFLVILTLINSAQELSFDLDKSFYSVGFKTILLNDDSRQFKFINQVQAVSRPLRIFIWYPAKKAKKPNYLNFGDYVYAGNLTKNPAQLNTLEKNDLQNKLAETLDYFKVTAEQVSDLMQAKTKAITDAKEQQGKFPLIVLGNVGEGFYYFATAEYLAANGYFVISLPSLGANEDERCGFDVDCLKIQEKDMEFAIREIGKLQKVDSTKIGVIAWSFSGLAAAHLSLKNKAIKAVVSLDAATGYQYGKEILDKSTELDVNQLKPPFLHFHGLGGNSRVAKNFDFFNSYPVKEKKMITMKNLQHSDFISLYGKGVRYARKDKNEIVFAEIEEVHLKNLNFLDKHLKIQ